MCIMAMYTTTCTRLVRKNNLVLLGMTSLLLVVGVRLVPLGLLEIILRGGVNQYYLILLINLLNLFFELFLHVSTIK